LLSEFGFVVPQGIGHITSRVPAILDEATNELPGAFKELVLRLLEHFKDLDRQVSEMEHQIEHWHRANALSRKLEKIPGIGPITASALVASVGDARNFANGRQLAAWLGLVPKQHSSGGKTNLQGISKRGDTYLRTLLIHGARAVIRQFGHKANMQGWLAKLLGRRNKNIAAVALANKNARIAWALLANDRHFQSDYVAA
jgi:transposase